MNFRIVQVTHGHNIRFKIQLRALWIFWSDYTEPDVAIDGWGELDHIIYWNSVHEAQEFIFNTWGHPNERIVKELKT